jgi:hypothetical protein
MPRYNRVSDRPFLVTGDPGPDPGGGELKRQGHDSHRSKCQIRACGSVVSQSSIAQLHDSVRESVDREMAQDIDAGRQAPLYFLHSGTRTGQGHAILASTA